MPEGPECKHYSECLNKIMQERHLTAINFVAGRYQRSSPSGFTSVKFPLLVKSVKVWGKFLFFETGQLNKVDNYYIWNTLGMSGQWSLQQNSDTRAIITIDNSDKVFYNDRRNFGTFHFHKTYSETAKKIDGLGYDLLNQTVVDFGVNPGFVIFEKKKNQEKTLAEILMSQTDYAGIGNYLKAEILYHAKLSPHRLGKSLTVDEIIQLDKSIIEVMIESYKGKTKSFNHYESTFPKLIYQKNKCPLGHFIKDEETKDGRTSWWCAECQK